MRTRPASIATIVIAIGLALTTIGIARVLPYTFGGVGSRATLGADLWAHGTAVSPALVALVFVGILAAIAMRPTRGGRRAASWLAILAAALVVTGLLEPAQLDLVLFGSFDAALTPLVYGLHVGLTALVLASIGEARRPDREARRPDREARRPDAAPQDAPARSWTTAAAAPDQGPVTLPAGAGAFAPG